MSRKEAGSGQVHCTQRLHSAGQAIEKHQRACPRGTGSFRAAICKTLLIVAYFRSQACASVRTRLCKRCKDGRSWPVKPRAQERLAVLRIQQNTPDRHSCQFCSSATWLLHVLLVQRQLQSLALHSRVPSTNVPQANKPTAHLKASSCRRPHHPTRSHSTTTRCSCLDFSQALAKASIQMCSIAQSQHGPLLATSLL